MLLVLFGSGRVGFVDVETGPQRISAALPSAQLEQPIA